VKIRRLLQGLPFVRQAEGERLTYYVFEANGTYLVVSPNNRGGLNMNVVDRETPEVISRRFSSDFLRLIGGIIGVHIGRLILPQTVAGALAWTCCPL
jgi:hypothetical protein